MSVSDIAWVYSFNVGVEAEAAGRSPTKSFQRLRSSLAALPWLLADPCDIVLAPVQRPEFLASLRAAGVHGLPEFHPVVPPGRPLAGHRPWGVAGEHLRRSNVARYRDDVAVCRSLDAVRQAVVTHGPKVVLKGEFSSAGLGVRVCDGASCLEAGLPDERWASNALRRDGVLTVEPYLEILGEFSGEWLRGEWCGVSHMACPHMRWSAACLDETHPSLSDELREFAFGGRGVERALADLDVPATCGSPTCGVDCAVVRAGSGALEVRPLEVNARYTMGHFALAAKRRVPGARRLDVVRVSELADRTDLLPLTDPQAAGPDGLCAVAQISEGLTAY